MLLAAGLLAVSLIIANIIHARENASCCARTKSQAAEEPVNNETGFRLIFRHRYLLSIALLMIVVNVVNTTGEFILSRTVTEGAQNAVAEEERQLAAIDKEKLTALEREKLAHDLWRNSMAISSSGSAFPRHLSNYFSYCAFSSTLVYQGRFSLLQ